MILHWSRNIMVKLQIPKSCFSEANIWSSSLTKEKKLLYTIDCCLIRTPYYTYQHLFVPKDSVLFWQPGQNKLSFLVDVNVLRKQRVSGSSPPKCLAAVQYSAQATHLGFSHSADGFWWGFILPAVALGHKKPQQNGPSKQKRLQKGRRWVRPYPETYSCVDNLPTPTHSFACCEQQVCFTIRARLLCANSPCSRGTQFVSGYAESESFKSIEFSRASLPGAVCTAGTVNDSAWRSLILKIWPQICEI